MKALFYKIFFITLCSCIDIHRLDTHGKPMQGKLTPETFIVSTFGLFRATLDKAGCGIRVQQFNNLTNLYQFKGRYFSESVKKDCSQLKIMPGELQTESGDRYMFAENLAYDHSTTFTIDDLGVMRLISTFVLQNLRGNNSTEFTIRDFETPNKYIGSYSLFTHSYEDPGISIKNERNWTFLAQIGQIKIMMDDNQGQLVNYVYTKIIIRNSSIYDFNQNTLPPVIFQNLTFPPRCNQPQKFIDFKPPFVLYADPYWPAGGVYDQGGYKMFEIAYSKLPQVQLNQNISEINFHRFFSHCPRRTFEYRGDCLGTCPPPYYHLIKGESGFCVLRCQQNSFVDQQKRTCSCVTSYQFDKLSVAKLVTPCPSKSTQTPYGCQCETNGFFFDGKYSFSCVQNCPNGTFGINKICMSCPDQCQACKRDGWNRMFLQCIECKPGYSAYKGQCIQTCTTKVANYQNLNNTCPICFDQNCRICNADMMICQKCNMLKALQNGFCVDTCHRQGMENIQAYTYSKGFNSVCLPKNDYNCTYYFSMNYGKEPFLKCDLCLNDMLAHLDGCVIQCPKGYRAHNKYCVCEGSKLTIHNKCLNISGCPIGMSFDRVSYSCHSCPFGCMSCVSNMCTSCNPGYYLYISPLAINCRRKNPLNACEKQYSWQQDNVCMLTDSKNLSLGMDLCIINVNNCKVCTPSSQNDCVLCMEGYLLYNNTCIKECPAGLLKYIQTCILPQIENCKVPHLLSLHKATHVLFQDMRENTPYAHFIYNFTQKTNDPVGNTIYFQDLIGMTLDGLARQTEFFQPSWICLKCNDGYGLNEDFTKCQPCPKQCPYKLCYMARKDSCLGPSRIDCGIHQYIDQQTNACLQSCNSSQKFPQVRQGRLYCVSAAKSFTKDFVRVDSSLYKMRDGKFLVFFVLSHALTKNVNVKVQSFNQSPKNSYQVSNNSTNTTISPTQIPSNKTIGDIPNNIQSSPVLQETIRDNQYVVIQNTSFLGHILDIKDGILNLTADSDIVFPSKVYGTVYLADHTEFMKTWLAYIGYVMAIVIILLHAVFIGNQLIYKVDNLLIFVQTIFFFSFVQNLVGRLLAQYYFGWSFAHARFLPNLFSSTIPDHYVELRAPISYKLVNMDGNYFRNAGFSLAWVFIYILCWGVISFFVWAIANRLLNKFQTWHPKVSRQALAAGVQFFSMNLMFFSVSQLAYSGDAYLNGFQDYYDRSNTLAIITIIVLSVYTFIRFLFNPIGGLYMLKRILIAVILVFGFQIKLMILPLIVLQLLFALLRYAIQRPIFKFQKITIWAESIIIIACYLLLFFCVDAAVNTIIISILIFIFIVYLAYDLINVYLESRNEFPEQKLIKQYEELVSEMNKQRARTVVYVNGDKKNEYKNEYNSKGAMSSIMQKF